MYIHLGLPLTSHDRQVQAITGGPVCAQMDIHTLRFAALAMKKTFVERGCCREGFYEGSFLRGILFEEACVVWNLYGITLVGDWV